MTTIKEINSEEIKKLEKEAEIVKKQYLNNQKTAQALRDSANAKLLALGLSPEEVAAITGA